MIKAVVQTESKTLFSKNILSMLCAYVKALIIITRPIKRS